MFDLSWIELSFVAALALIVIGPKDLPKMFKILAQLMTKAKRTVSDFKGSLVKLEKEIDLSSGSSSSPRQWIDLLPEEVRNLPDDFVPGSLPPEHHDHRQQALEKARDDFDKRVVNDEQ